MPPIASGLDEHAVLDILREGLQEERVELALQPIVSLPQRKRRFYECFSRVRAGHGLVIMPEQYIALAERAGLITAIDNMLLFRCIQLLRKIRQRNLELGSVRSDERRVGKEWGSPCRYRWSPYPK